MSGDTQKTSSGEIISKLLDYHDQIGKVKTENEKLRSQLDDLQKEFDSFYAAWNGDGKPDGEQGYKAIIDGIHKLKMPWSRVKRTMDLLDGVDSASGQKPLWNVIHTAKTMQWAVGIIAVAFLSAAGTWIYQTWFGN